MRNVRMRPFHKLPAGSLTAFPIRKPFPSAVCYFGFGKNIAFWTRCPRLPIPAFFRQRKSTDISGSRSACSNFWINFPQSMPAKLQVIEKSPFSSPAS